MKSVVLPGGEAVPALGLGTWNMGDARARRAEELAALRAGLDAGLRLIDTAEMYGDGRAEELVAEAIAGRRDEVFLVSKVLPGNATRRGTLAACEASLARLKTDRIDLYLLHWRGGTPFAETLEALQALQRAGKIRHYGVSNLDLADMHEWWAAPGGPSLATNQLLYNLTRRGIAFDLLPWLRERGVSVMTYSPLEQARMLNNRALLQIAAQAGCTPAQLALAWLLAQDGVIAIPKSGSVARVLENRAALDLRLTPELQAALDRAFPPPRSAQPLEML